MGNETDLLELKVTLETWVEEVKRLVRNQLEAQARIEQLEEHASDLSQVVQQMADRLQTVCEDNVLLDWKISKLLSALDPEQCPDPGPEPDVEMTPDESPGAGNGESKDLSVD